MKTGKIRIVIESIAWLCFIIFPVLLFPTMQPFMQRGVLNPALLGIIVTHGLLIIFYYINYYFLIPRFLFSGKKKLYPVLLISSLTILLLFLMSQPGFNIFPEPIFKYSKLTFAFSIFIRFAVVTMVSVGISHIERLQESEEQKVKSELSFLKAQINPHFLFNTLNSIYALTVKRSEAAPESVSRLSSIMRYVINETTSDFVSAEKEIDYLNSYIELERLRLTEKVNLIYKVEGDINGQQIAPLIFLPLIENAFKHGVSTRQHCEITIVLRFSPQLAELHVENSVPGERKKPGMGLGLQNVKKRLSLLYPGRHTLEIKETDQRFIADLKIILA